MSTQQTLHRRAIDHLSALADILDRLKDLGPDELDGNNAIMNIAERLDGLMARMPQMPRR